MPGPAVCGPPSRLLLLAQQECLDRGSASPSHSSLLALPAREPAWAKLPGCSLPRSWACLCLVWRRLHCVAAGGRRDSVRRSATGTWALRGRPPGARSWPDRPPVLQCVPDQLFLRQTRHWHVRPACHALAGYLVTQAFMLAALFILAGPCACVCPCWLDIFNPPE